MKYFDIVWYLEHEDMCNNILNVSFLILVLIIMYLGFQLLSFLAPLYNVLIIAALLAPTAVAYYIIKQVIENRCSRLVHRYSSQFKKKPFFRGKVGEKLVDRLDIRIIKTIKDLGGNYSAFVPVVVEWLPIRRMIERLGKLNALGYVEVYKGKIIMNSEGLDLLALPSLSLQASIPKHIAAGLAQNRMNLSNGRFKDVVVDISKILELMLRDALGELKKEKREKVSSKPYNKWTLGELKAAASMNGIVNNISENILNAIIKLRNDFIHASRNRHELSPEVTASTIMSLMEALIKQWFPKQ